VTVVNETFVKTFFPNEEPLGRRITADMTSYFPKLTIVGVVADNKMHGLDREPVPLLYWSIDQFPSSDAWLVVRSRGTPDHLTHALVSAVTRLDGDLAVKNPIMMPSVVSDSIWRPRFVAVLLGVFAGLALVLATAGIYAVMSYAVAQRTSEIGLRLSLGARPGAILGLIVGHAARLALIGNAIGIATSLALRRLVTHHLFGVSPSDPLTIVLVSVGLMVVAVAASAVPAIRALRLEPVAALRET
jgi:hypothetical protein